MSRYFKFFGILILSAFVLACTGPKSLTKKGDKFSEAGIHKEAINYYIKALTKKSSHVDALIGLKNSGQVVLNEYTSAFFKAYTVQEYKTAVYNYIELEEFVNKVNRYGADFTISAVYQEDFLDARSKYIAARFEEANQLLSEEKFKSANRICEEIEKLDPNFDGDNFEKIKEVSLLEPHYREGSEHFNNKKFRNAYYSFLFINDKNPNYKDTKFRLATSLENAQYNIGMLKFENYSNDASAAAYIASEITKQIINSNDPFVTLIDRSYTEKILKEQMLNYEGMTVGSGSIKAGELIGAKALLAGSVLKIEKQSAAPRAKKVKAYREERIKKYNSETKKSYYETKYHKTEYLEYYGYNKVSISFKFQLISTETGKILSSEVIEVSDKSEVNYATYSGNYKQLVPGTWKHKSVSSSADKVVTSRSARNSLKSYFTASTKLTPSAEIQTNLQKQIAYNSAKKILAFNPED